jgi:starvation-inducible DNA-binding protein
MLGQPAPGSLAEFLRLTHLREEAGERLDAATMVQRLLADHETIVSVLRMALAESPGSGTGVGDVGTVDFLTGVLRSHEEQAWMLRAWLEGRE